MKAFLIVEGGDAKTAQWFYADAGWKALDEAKSSGFCETCGFAIVLTLPADKVCVEEFGL